ncbi:MAG: signal peptidase I [Candidatus Omnitrophica bacterium CG11_big_fil_rev_8_21_14_0_20_64_10]|nr:MAG: signal peptidase I [Candidatus Omnitrophica bacterium CG11_big_fil_rev_8_21_14_0_20_64_10]
MDDPPIFLERVYYNRGAFGRAGQPFHVPEGELFFMGDNSGSSKDSRYFGSVSERHVVGRTFLIMWPLKRIRYFR